MGGMMRTIAISIIRAIIGMILTTAATTTAATL